VLEEITSLLAMPDLHEREERRLLKAQAAVTALAGC
jgi:hypothetical protein